MCKLCNNREKFWNGSNPQCGFNESIFSEENWNCATLNQLRKIANELDTVQYMDDCSLATIPVKDNGWIILSWYKNRGRTSKAIFMIDDTLNPLPLEIAEKAIKQYGKEKPLNDDEFISLQI